jgi:dolichol-phosphate mannosyltransferase
MAGAAWLILPTFDEAENIEAIVRAADAVLARAAPGGHRILVVDDDSPDGHGRDRRPLAAELPALAVLHRTERLASARPTSPASRGAGGGRGLVLEMDSDFSHDPADLVRLLDAVRGPADLALGSRYVPGGGVSDWEPRAAAISRGGSGTPAACSGWAPRRDEASSASAEVLRARRPASVRSHGYAFPVELTYRAIARAFRVARCRSRFRERRRGSSKMTCASPPRRADGPARAERGA